MTDPPLPPLKTKWFLQSPGAPPPPPRDDWFPPLPPLENHVIPQSSTASLFIPPRDDWSLSSSLENHVTPPRVLRYPAPLPEWWIRTGPLFPYLKHLRLWLYLNPIHPNISMHILHTFLYIFTEVMTRRICQKIKGFFGWWSFPLISWH